MCAFWSKKKISAGRPYGRLSRALAVQLRRVPASRDGQVEYRPCRAVLADGRQLDCVYFVDADSYIKRWGVWPEDDSGKRHVEIESVVEIENSPFRLPTALANRLYKSGESGMGYRVFTVEFRGGVRQAYVTGNAVDFITPPAGLKSSDAARVIPHQGRDHDPVAGPKYWWCLYRGREGDA